ncbi:hypothetical protein C8J57DRAFT_1731026 [Mycena rebaudengoi]|nr:hypothetical protein C8J57DRAFT_1731026 [Mycena rebaudengoi]
MARAEAAFYQRAYAPAELRTFHCEKVRKMLLSGLDPSMLLGFVCRYEGEWVDLRRRIALLPRTIFAIQDEPPTWPGEDDDDDMGLESVSDPEEEAVDADDGEGGMWFFDKGSLSVSYGISSSGASHAHAATHYHSNSNSTSSARTRSEDPVAPLTPLPITTRFDLSRGRKAQDGAGEKAGRRSPRRRTASLMWMRGGRMTSRSTGSTRCRRRRWLHLRRPRRARARAGRQGGEGEEREAQQDEEGGSGARAERTLSVPGVGGGWCYGRRAAAAAVACGRAGAGAPVERDGVAAPDGAGPQRGAAHAYRARARRGGRIQSGGVREVLTTDD